MKNKTDLAIYRIPYIESVDKLTVTPSQESRLYKEGRVKPLSIHIDDLKLEDFKFCHITLLHFTYLVDGGDKLCIRSNIRRFFIAWHEYKEIKDRTIPIIGSLGDKVEVTQTDFIHCWINGTKALKSPARMLEDAKVAKKYVPELERFLHTTAEVAMNEFNALYKKKQ